ncbi:tyrosine-type recombinase/integrase [Terasakiella pusilla]|uniref:tyrosine-type recombinase/integrase n=1 Tax=Terasakiella pusilla TaxID=64973 RepID=UPI003AA8C97E
MASIHKVRNKWRVQIRKHGHKISRTFSKKADASRWAATEESRLEMLRNRPEEILKSITLADLLRRYLKEITPTKRTTTADREVTRINRLLKQTIATTTLDRLTPGIVATFRDQRMKEITEGSVRHDLCLISLTVDAARKEWDIPITTNPVSLIRKPRSPNPRQRRLTVDEWSTLMVIARQSYQACLVDMVEFAVETAMRRSELVRISPADLILDKSLLHIPITKNGHPRTIPLSERATTEVAPICWTG